MVLATRYGFGFDDDIVVHDFKLLETHNTRSPASDNYVFLLTSDRLQLHIHWNLLLSTIAAAASGEQQATANASRTSADVSVALQQRQRFASNAYAELLKRDRVSQITPMMSADLQQ